MTAAHQRGGVVLPLVLVLITVLGLVASGSLALANRELSSAIAETHVERAKAAAEGAATSALATLAADTTGIVWGSGPLSVLQGSAEGVAYGASLDFLNREWGLLLGRGRLSPAAPEHPSALVVWSLDPLARVGATSAVLLHGGALQLSSGADVSGTSIADPGTDPACAPWQAVIDSVFPTGSLRANRLAGWLPPRAPPYLGVLEAVDLEDLLSPVSSSVSPAPVVAGGACVPSADNWGSPLDPAGPCGSRRVSGYSAGSVVLGPGEGQGLLVVDGDLTVLDGTTFSGLLVVRDSLSVGPDALISGLVRAGGTVRIGARARLDGNACAAVLALDADAQLQSLRAPRGPWLRPFQRPLP